MHNIREQYRHVLNAFGLLSLVSIGFWAIISIMHHSMGYWYLVWNLGLAWLPLLVSILLVRFLEHHAWSSWTGLFISLIWLMLLPNSFYIVTDFIHLGDIGQLDVLYEAVMFILFALTGLALGFASLYLVHRQLLSRYTTRLSGGVIGFVLLICSFAIYVGRDLRWNSWDAIVHPAGVLFDISDAFINPRIHVDAFTTTLTFLMLLGSLYIAGWWLARGLRHLPR